MKTEIGILQGRYSPQAYREQRFLSPLLEVGDALEGAVPNLPAVRLAPRRDFSRMPA
jgi:hypothetical protein